MKFEFLDEVDARAYWTDYDEPIVIVLDYLMGRKNESIKKVIKTLSFWYLQETICMTAPWNAENCAVWCPMETAARHMLL